MIPLLVFVVAAALLYFAVVETAFGLLMRLPGRLEAERDSAHDPLGAYLEDPLTFFVPARLAQGSLLVLLAVLLAQPIGTGFVPALGTLGIAIAIQVSVCHLLPAFLARRRPQRVLEFLLPSFTAVATVVGPLTALVILWLGEHRRARDAGAMTDAGEPRTRTETTPEARPDENRLLRSVVDFGETLVREVMTPRPDIVAIPADATIDDLRALVREQEYSRLPVFSGNLDNIVGLVVVKDLIHTPDLAGPQKVSEIMRPPAFVPETKRVADLLHEFQQKRFQLALVVDEYGGTAGLVTIEDVVEELVGEIRDEYDSEAEPIVAEPDGAFVFSAKVATSEMADRLGLEIAGDGFETVGGYVLTRIGRVPAVGERFTVDGLEIEILEAERRRIHKVRIRRLPPPEEPAA